MCVAYNLGWKLAHVIRQTSPRSLLQTYTTERRQIAQELIAFDQRFSRLFSGRPATASLSSDDESVDLGTFKAVFEKGNLFASGCAVDYQGSLVVDKDRGKQELATGVKLGMRMPSCRVLNQSDARPWQLQELLPSTGQWRVVVFAGRVGEKGQFARYERLGEALKGGGVVGRAVQRGVVEVLTVHSSPRKEIELLDLPEVFHPFSEELGWDYGKVFVDDVSYHEGHGEAYKNYGIDPVRGCLVVVRPDQHVAWIGELEDVEEMDRFFGGVLRV